MEKISYRELQRMSASKLQGLLPCGITVDSQGIAIILSVESYKKLLGNYKGNRQLDSQSVNTTKISGLKIEGNRIVGVSKAVQPIETMPLYNPDKRHNTGDKVLVKRGRRLVEVTVPEIDGDGKPIWEEE